MGGGEKEEKIVFYNFSKYGKNDRFERARGLVDSFFFSFKFQYIRPILYKKKNIKVSSVNNVTAE